METNNRQLSKVSRYNFKKVLNISRLLFQGASTCDGGLQVAFQRNSTDCVVGAQLLLQVSQQFSNEQETDLTNRGRQLKKVFIRTLKIKRF